MRFAVIDCGTNTFHLLIAEVRNKSTFKVLVKKQSVVKLGEGWSHSRIAEKPFRRGLKALKSYRHLIDEYNVKVVKACATSGIREAENGKQFLHEAQLQCNIKPEIISGKREAELIYKGVCRAITVQKGTSLIMDIGGGSVEFIIFSEKGMLWKQSFRCGAAFLNQLHSFSDPATLNEVRILQAYLQKLLTPLLNACRRFQPGQLIGSAGSFETFAQMIIAQTHGSSLKGQKQYVFRMEDYKAIHKKLLVSTMSERKKMKGLVKMRIDTIVMASVLLTFVLRNTGISKMQMSAFSLKEGILSELINEYY